MPRPLDQAVVAITGASSGIGRAAALRFARIDVWVNNAGVIAYGEFAEIPPEVWGRVSTPQVSPYVISKSAVRALSECLRGELAGEQGIHVTTMAPQAVDTPIFDHAANYSGHRIGPVPPILSVEEVAAGIEACAESPKREVNYARAGRLLEVLYAVAPPLYRRLAHAAFLRGTLAPVPAPHSPGNTLESASPHAIGGGWRGARRPTLRRAFAAAGAGAAAGLAGAKAAPPGRRR